MADRRTIQQRIESCEGRIERYEGRIERPYLNLTFSADKIQKLVQTFNLNANTHNLNNLTAKIGEKLNVQTTKYVGGFPIAELLKTKQSASLSIRIEAILELCQKYNIDPKTRGLSYLVKALCDDVIPS